MQKIVFATALALGSCLVLAATAQKPFASVDGRQAENPVSTKGARTRAVAHPRPAPEQPAAAITASTPASTVAADSKACTTITSLPHTIIRPGRYCYGSDLASTSFQGLRIGASGVTLDCRGYRTTTTLPRTGGSDGIYIDSGARNVTIRNCRVVGFDRGISAYSGSVNAHIIDNHVDQSVSAGITAWGDGAMVVGNRVTNTHPVDATQYSAGIKMLAAQPETASRNQQVLRNVVVNVYGGQQTAGIVILGSAGPLVKGNTVMELRPTNGGEALGLWLNDWAQGARTTAAVLEENQLIARGPGYSDLVTQGSHSTQACTRNITVGVAVSNFSSCPTGAGNVVVP